MRQLLTASPVKGPLGPLVALLDTSVRWICAATLWLCFLAMLLPTFANAVLRYATNASLVWSVEVVQLTFPWFIMAGAVLAAQHCRHISVELFLNMLPDRWKLLITIPIQILIVVTCGAVIYVYLGLGMFEGGMKFAAGDVSFTSLGIPQLWSYLAIFAGYALLGVTALTNIYRQVTGDPGLTHTGTRSIS
ncbi:MAG: TRAP transporter small permease [Pseudomonadota bacterium]